MWKLLGSLFLVAAILGAFIAFIFSSGNSRNDSKIKPEEILNAEFQDEDKFVVETAPWPNEGIWFVGINDITYDGHFPAVTFNPTSLAIGDVVKLHHFKFVRESGLPSNNIETEFLSATKKE